MAVAEIFLIAVALSMDAFAVALCKGLGMKKMQYGRCFIIALFFGVFQFIMPLIGWLVSFRFQEYIASCEHLLIFLLLSLIGAKMIYESFQSKSFTSREAEHFKLRGLFLLAIGTSIDALGVGMSFVMFSKSEIVSSALLIGVVTFCLSFIGVIIGNTCGNRYEKKAECLGGFILLYIACKSLFEHLYSA